MRTPPRCVRLLAGAQRGGTGTGEWIQQRHGRSLVHERQPPTRGAAHHLAAHVGQRFGQDLLLRDTVEADTVRVGVEREQEEWPKGRERDGSAPWGASGSKGYRVVA